MEQRYATSPEQIPRMDTEELRKRYLVQNLFVHGEIKAVFSHQDRIVMAGISPVAQSLTRHASFT